MDTSKKILLYTPRYGQKNWNFGEGNLPFETALCRVQNCYLTSNISFLANITDYDAILFHISGMDGKLISNLPKNRNWDKQKYVFAAAAPPKDGKFSFHEKIK